MSNQWETYKPHNVSVKHKGFLAHARKYTNLKDGYIVRYADDFKIMCRNYEDAKRFYHATIDFLKIRLGLEINEDKSRVVNLRLDSPFQDFRSTCSAREIQIAICSQNKYGTKPSKRLRNS